MLNEGGWGGMGVASSAACACGVAWVCMNGRALSWCIVGAATVIQIGFVWVGWRARLEHGWLTATGRRSAPAGFRTKYGEASVVCGAAVLDMQVAIIRPTTMSHTPPPVEQMVGLNRPTSLGFQSQQEIDNFLQLLKTQSAALPRLDGAQLPPSLANRQPMPIVEGAAPSSSAAAHPRSP